MSKCSRHPNVLICLICRIGDKLFWVISALFGLFMFWKYLKRNEVNDSTDKDSKK